ncbi:hypothetical protein MMC27_006949 [Xylographa pallens]|nr:hypothetical protein [Xylographa pallens]
MASIGKIALSLASGTQEATLALANINFDFSMVKLTAPTEYQGLGASLSHKRKRQAEDGSTHITARKLGALFADDLPSTPNLARAYGLRVSEIAENPKLNPHGGKSDGALADLVGADGTSIWAAATSGKGAMAVHLLACMLARIWPGPEATAIWSELVVSRKGVLQRRLQESEFPITTVAAAQIEVPRDNLAEWDASARSWLRTADTAKRRQQTQLMLIIDNIQSVMPAKNGIYDSVMEAWKNAMSVVDKLISGIAQDVQSTETLLGISAWHLYPDMFVLGRESTHVKQNDELIKPGGLMTVGSHHTYTNENCGLSWSMPLAQLLYYGKPVVSTRSVDSKSLRVPFDRLLSVALGSLMNRWGLSSSEPERIATFLVFLWDCLDSDGQHKVPWINSLAQCAKSFLVSSGNERSEQSRYIALGRRRYGSFLAPGVPPPGKATCSPPFFGLTDLDAFLKLLEPEERIAKLRDIAKTSDFGVDITKAFIRYTPKSPKKDVTNLDSQQNSEETLIYEYATLFPHPTSDGHGSLHRRWIEVQMIPDHKNARSSVDSLELYINRAIDRSIELIRCTGEACGYLNSHAVEQSNHRPDWEMGCDVLSWMEHPYLLDAAGLGALAKIRYAQSTHRAAEQRLLEIKLNLGAFKHSFDGRYYSSFLGNSEAQIYQPVEMWKTVNYSINPEEVIENLVSKKIQAAALKDHIYNLSTQQQELSCSLNCLYLASRLYSSLSGSEIDLSVLSIPLWTSLWAMDIVSADTDWTITHSFACIAMFETGVFNMYSGDFDEVVAISAGNTLYVSEVLLCDPSARPSPHRIRALVGNIGKPGLALLLLPKNPIRREPDLETWQMVNHAEFDGIFQDNFRGTSLHLSLTGYEQALKIGQHGGRDKQIYYLEAVVAALHNGSWVADLDIWNTNRKLDNFLKKNIQHLPSLCSHSDAEQADFSYLAKLTSIDNWYEFLDRPQNAMIVRAKGNWTARLAFATATANMQQPLVVGSEKICWACAKHLILLLGLDPCKQTFLC